MRLLDELRNGPSYILNSDEKELRNRCADELERVYRENADLKEQVTVLNNLLIRERNK